MRETASGGLFDLEIPGATPWRRGKVRIVYDLGPRLLLVATDRLSAYDSVLPTAILDKGRVLTALSAWWFGALAAARPHHVLSTRAADFPAPFAARAELVGRSMLCAKAKPVAIECVVRGHLTGAGWREYKEHGTLHGEILPAGLHDGSPLDPPRFTPTTKALAGHDEPIPAGGLPRLIGAEIAAGLEARSRALFDEAAPIASAHGLVLADTKFEFGFVDGALTLIDELLSPDSSRYWDKAAYDAGRLESFDKQFVRDWLDACGWNHDPPAPALPDDVVAKTRARYVEAARRFLGAGWSPGEVPGDGRAAEAGRP